MYLPPEEACHRFVEVDFGGGSAIGSYSAELTYGTYIGENNPIEPYPFNFRVLGEELFQEEIEQNKGGTTIIIPIEIQVTLGGVISISVAIGIIYLWKRKEK